MEFEKVSHYIHRVIFQSDIFKTKHFLVLFSAFADEVIEVVLAVNLQRFLVENFAESGLQQNSVCSIFLCMKSLRDRQRISGTLVRTVLDWFTSFFRPVASRDTRASPTTAKNRNL
jgi:hypothetical protein